MGFKLAGDYAPQQFEVITPVEIRALIVSVSLSPEEEVAAEGKAETQEKAD